MTKTLPYCFQQYFFLILQTAGLRLFLFFGTAEDRFMDKFVKLKIKMFLNTLITSAWHNDRIWSSGASKPLYTEPCTCRLTLSVSLYVTE